MTLSFSTQWPDHMPELMAGRSTKFIEKIHNGLQEIGMTPSNAILDPKDFGTPLFDLVAPKYHTIREDKHDRWAPGTDIHFVINNRTADRFQFAPVVKCRSVQKIEIVYDVDLCEKYGSEPAIVVDSKPLTILEEEKLAKNDGFDSIQDFFSWFNKDFKGKIIHWTDLKY